MTPSAKEENKNPRLTGTLLLLFSLVFLLLGGKNLYTIGTTFYFNGQTTEGVVKNITRNAWPQFRTFNYELEFYDQQNNFVSANATVAHVVANGSTVPLVYSKNNPQNVYHSGSFLAAAGYSLGTLALGFILSVFGISQINQRPSSQQSATGSDLGAQTKKQSPLLKTCQNILILAFMACVAGYLMGGGSGG